MNLHWPQITMMFLLAWEFAMVIVRGSGKKDGNYISSVFAAFVRIGILLFVLIEGGFFG